MKRKKYIRPTVTIIGLTAEGGLLAASPQTPWAESKPNHVWVDEARNGHNANNGYDGYDDYDGGDGWGPTYGVGF